VCGFEAYTPAVARTRRANDNGARKKLYDLLPKKPRS
jgi:chromosome partitioning protein